jgi:hypothetical protein
MDAQVMGVAGAAVRRERRVNASPVSGLEGSSLDTTLTGHVGCSPESLLELNLVL